VAGAVHRTSWRRCGARGRRWGRGCLSCGRRYTQNFLEEKRRAWAPLGPRLPFAWQAQYTEHPNGAAARVGAAGAAAAFRVAGAVHDPPGGARARVGDAGAAAAFLVAVAMQRASSRSSGARRRTWGRGCLSRGRRSTQSLLVELRRAWVPLEPRLPHL